MTARFRSPKFLLSVIGVIGVIAVVVVVLTRQGGHSAALPAWETQPLEKALPVLNNGDPDAEAGDAGEDMVATLRSLGHGHFLLRVENDSALGFVNTFTWVPPPYGSLTITAVTSTSKGSSCSLSGANITCRTNLHPPKCTCAPGESMLIRFDGVTPKTADSKLYPKLGRITHAFTYGSLRIGEITPVPYLIPDSPGEAQPQADVPSCKSGQQSSDVKACTGG